MSSDDERWIAFAISTICRSPSESSSTSAQGSIAAPRRSCSTARACASIRRRSTRPKRCGRCGRWMFSATLRFSNRLSSWWMVPMPNRSASAGDSAARVRPSKCTAPESGAIRPLRMFFSVDLPAPFSPTSIRISPRSAVKLTSCQDRDAGETLADGCNAEQRPPRLVRRHAWLRAGSGIGSPHSSAWGEL